MIKALNNRFCVKFMQIEIGLLAFFNNRANQKSSRGIVSSLSKHLYIILLQ